MKDRVWFSVLVRAVFAVLVGFAAMCVSASAADCSQGSASVQSGCQIYHAVGVQGYSCVGCHGEPGFCNESTDQNCDTDPHNPNSVIGKSISLLGASKAVLKMLTSPNDTNAFMSLSRAQLPPQCVGVNDGTGGSKCATMVIFNQSGVTSEQAFDDLAAYLANADPAVCAIKSAIAIVHCTATYGFSGIVYRGAKLSPGLLSINVTSDYNPVNPLISMTHSQANPNDLDYTVSGLLAGDYTVTPGTFPYLHFPPSCALRMTYAWTLFDTACFFPSADFDVGGSAILTGVLALVQQVANLAQQDGAPLAAVQTQLLGVMNKVNFQLAESDLKGATSSLDEFVQLTESFVRRHVIPDAAGRRLIQQAGEIIAQLKGSGPRSGPPDSDTRN